MVERIDVKEVDFDEVGGKVYALVRLTDGCIYPIEVSEEKLERLKRCIESLSIRNCEEE